MLTAKQLNEFDEIDIREKELYLQSFYWDKNSGKEMEHFPLDACTIIYSGDDGDNGTKSQTARFSASIDEENKVIHFGYFGGRNELLVAWKGWNYQLSLLYTEESMNEYPLEMIQNLAQSCTDMLYATMFFMMHFQSNEEYVYRETKQVQYRHSSRNHKPKKRVVHIGKTVFKIQSGPPTTGRTFERHTASWTVRGHWRNLKNGNQTWVKPHVKGAGQVSKKTYKV